MKKIIILLVMLISVNIFSEQWTTDGKDNLEKIEGFWKSEKDIKVLIKKIDNEWFMIVITQDKYAVGSILEKYKTGMFQLKEFDGTYLAWDTKYNKVVIIDGEKEIRYKLTK